MPGSVTPAVTPGYSRPVAILCSWQHAAAGQAGSSRRWLLHRVGQGGERRGIALPRSRWSLAGDVSRARREPAAAGSRPHSGGGAAPPRPTPCEGTGRGAQDTGRLQAHGIEHHRRVRRLVAAHDRCGAGAAVVAREVRRPCRPDHRVARRRARRQPPRRAGRARGRRRSSRSLVAKTVADTRATFRSLMDGGAHPGARRVEPGRSGPAAEDSSTARRALTAAEARALVAAAADARLGAAVALLFVQGWRVSEVLGLAWSDLDLDAGVANVSRASVYADGVGMMLGPPKTEGAKGQHLLTPVVVDLLRRRRRVQNEERLRAGGGWREAVYEGRPVDLVFTTATGGLVLRQAVAKAVAPPRRRRARSDGARHPRRAIDRHHGAVRRGRPRPGRHRPPRRPRQPRRRPRATCGTSVVGPRPPPRRRAGSSIPPRSSPTVPEPVIARRSGLRQSSRLTRTPCVP